MQRPPSSLLLASGTKKPRSTSSLRRRELLSVAAGAVLGNMFAGVDTVLATDGASPIRLRELYNKDSSFSDIAQAVAGERIAVVGYMAPPLKAESTFFVLSNRPMTVCPFCESDADWPDDILAVYAKRVIKVVPFNAKITVQGTLELGGYRDTDTGFYSRVRLNDATFRRG